MPLNPFDWRGPQFLLFYLAFGLVVLAVLAWLRRTLEPAATDDSLEPLRRGLWLGRRGRASTAAGRADADLSDPYLVASLRGGISEVLRVATVALIDRGLLTLDEDDRLTAVPRAPEQVSRPVEKAILSFFATAGDAQALLQHPPAQLAAAAYEETLSERGLIADDALRRRRRDLWVGALVLLWLTAGVKVAIALSRGRSNVGFLLLLAGLFTVVSGLVANRRRTRRGDEFLADLRQLFAGLSGRAQTLAAGSGSSDVVLLAAVFGPALLPAGDFPFVRRLFAGHTGDGSSGSGCGSSCGSSCGGGCGGGCGGCGS